MAKAPVEGQVKTRLSPPLTPRQVAALYRCFLLDRIAQVERCPGVIPIVAYAPRESRPFFRRIVPASFHLIPQRGKDLGERMADAFARGFALGLRRIVLVGSDTPTLPDLFLHRALRALRRVDLILGPSPDGGYYLIGLKEAHPSLFEGIAWSTDQVFVQTLERARASHLRVSRLPAWYDVDTPEDLARLKCELLTVRGERAVQTRRYLLRGLDPDR